MRWSCFVPPSASRLGPKREASPKVHRPCEGPNFIANVDFRFSRVSCVGPRRFGVCVRARVAPNYFGEYEYKNIKDCGINYTRLKTHTMPPPVQAPRRKGASEAARKTMSFGFTSARVGCCLLDGPDRICYLLSVTTWIMQWHYRVKSSVKSVNSVHRVVELSCLVVQEIEKVSPRTPLVVDAR